MAEEALLKEYKLDTLNVLLPSAFDQIEVDVEYIIYNTLFLQECVKDFNRAYDLLERYLKDTDKRHDMSQSFLELKELYLHQDRDELIRESHNAINDCLDGLREILRSIAGLKGFVEDFEYRGSKKQVIDINDALLSLILALKQKWNSKSELNMELDTKVLPLEGVKSNLYHVFGMTLLYHIQFLNEQVPTGAKAKGLLLVKTTAAGFHNEITIASRVANGISKGVSTSLEKHWQKRFPCLKWIIVSQHKGSIEVYRQRLNMCETVITLPSS